MFHKEGHKIPLRNAPATAPEQFDFGRQWKKRIVRLLNDPGLTTALTFGMMLHDPNYRPGDPPWKYGRDPVIGRQPRRGTLAWYQPSGACHFIAPFCWKLGRILFPTSKWGFISGKLHTVVIGWGDEWSRPDWVMDILLFKDMTAEESLALAKADSWTFSPSFESYAASFCSNPRSQQVVGAARTVATAIG